MAQYDWTMADESSSPPVSLERGAAVPPFHAATVDGRSVDYSTIWQRRNLVLVTLTADDASMGTYVSRLAEAMPAFRSHQAECIVTRESIPGVASPSVLIADRWGEIVHVARGSTATDLLPVPEILEWLAYLQIRCPECEGEAK